MNTILGSLIRPRSHQLLNEIVQVLVEVGGILKIDKIRLEKTINVDKFNDYLDHTHCGDRLVRAEEKGVRREGNGGGKVRV